MSRNRRSKGKGGRGGGGPRKQSSLKPGSKRRTRDQSKASPRSWPEGKLQGVTQTLDGVLYVALEVPGFSELVPIKNAPPGLKADLAVEVELVEPPGGRSRYALPFARILATLGDAKSQDVEIARILSSRDIPVEFPPAVLEEASALPAEILEQELAGRKDLRSLPFVTIDGEDAKDFDDAVLVEARAKGGWLLRVAIADVAHYVRRDSPLDREAYERSTSVYFPGRCIPMLPERLSNGLCSLRPDEDRLAMVVSLELSPTGEPGLAQICNAVIRSQARLTYAQAQASLAGNQEAAGPAWPHRKRLQHMAAAAERLRERRLERGALDLDLPEPHVIMEEDSSTVRTVERRERLEAHRLIEGFMLATNEAVGAYFLKRGVPTIFRIHPKPLLEKLESFASMAAAYGFDVPAELTAGINGRAMARFLESLEDSPLGRAIHYLALRSLTRAEYAVEDVGHFGLAASGYLHFTSPIRRYPDLMVHRLLKGLLTQGKRRQAKNPEDLDAIASRCSINERRAMEAEYAALDLYRCLSAQKHLGRTFEGSVSSVAEFGLFVQIAEPFLEGMIHVSGLGDDFYDFDERRLALVGRRQGRRYQLGDVLLVKISQVDMRRHKISLLPAPTSPSA